ncbi:hypothetical protein [Providencia hangzhouensis]|uniref:hypothetical protein n=1 Tax=Providencia hangzhouensis TaxID=3031799 RepID=UPI0039798AF4
MHGIQWKIEDEMVEQETIKSLIEKAEAHEQAEKAEEERKKNEFKQGVEFQKTTRSVINTDNL